MDVFSVTIYLPILSVHLTAPVIVGPCGGDVAIAVLLDELAVTLVVLVRTLEAFAVLVHLDGRTVALAVFIGALELRTVSVSANAFAVYLTVLERAFKGVALLGGQLPAAVRLVVFPLTSIGGAALP